jgi:hypothetical protein
MARLALWLIKPVAHHPDWGWDTARGFVVRASSEEEARMIASLPTRCTDDVPPELIEGSGDEGPYPWLDKSQTTCVRLHDRGPRGVILRDFLNG